MLSQPSPEDESRVSVFVVAVDPFDTEGQAWVPLFLVQVADENTPYEEFVDGEWKSYSKTKFEADFIRCSNEQY